MLRRALIEIGVPYECAICGNAGCWLDAPLTLEVDHIDGDLYNNSPSNLRFLCPNCHRQTPNFAGRSRGKYTQFPLPLGA
jgi:5-methylcytosine-specific restriction endonuclease McrA